MRDSAKRVDKPWGYEIIYAHTDRYVGKILHINPGEALSLQYHRRKDETLYLLDGEYELEVEENGQMVCYSMRPGDSYRVTPNTKHRMTTGESSCEILEVSTPELEDVVRLEDRYGRVHAGS
jgi:mannose-6-phosphate isomerase-like protein (cupin superfamily)